MIILDLCLNRFSILYIGELDVHVHVAPKTAISCPFISQAFLARYMYFDACQKLRYQLWLPVAYQSLFSGPLRGKYDKVAVISIRHADRSSLSPDNLISVRSGAIGPMSTRFYLTVSPLNPALDEADQTFPSHKLVVIWPRRVVSQLRWMQILIKPLSRRGAIALQLFTTAAMKIVSWETFKTAPFQSASFRWV